MRAYHVERSAHVGDEAAIALLCRAAEAADLASPAEAAHWYAGALRLLPEDDHERRSGLLGQLALTLMALGRYEEARDALLEALAQPGENWIVLTILHARTETLLGRHAEARRRLLAAREAVPQARAELGFELAVRLRGVQHGRGDDVRAWTGRPSRPRRNPVLVGPAGAGAPRWRPVAGRSRRVGGGARPRDGDRRRPGRLGDRRSAAWHPPCWP